MYEEEFLDPMTQVVLTAVGFAIGAAVVSLGVVIYVVKKVL